MKVQGKGGKSTDHNKYHMPIILITPNENKKATFLQSGSLSKRENSKDNNKEADTIRILEWLKKGMTDANRGVANPMTEKITENIAPYLNNRYPPCKKGFFFHFTCTWDFYPYFRCNGGAGKLAH
jgi:hypothetical protein